MVGFGGGGHDPMKGDAHDADKPEDLLVLLAETSGESLPDGLLEGVEAVGKGSYPRGLVTLEKPEGRRLAVVEAARPELLQSILVAEAVGEPLDEFHRRTDGLLGGELFQGVEVLDLADKTVEPRLGDVELVLFEDDPGFVQYDAVLESIGCG